VAPAEQPDEKVPEELPGVDNSPEWKSHDAPDEAHYSEAEGGASEFWKLRRVGSVLIGLMELQLRKLISKRYDSHMA
jgi:hypothetical protein